MTKKKKARKKKVHKVDKEIKVVWPSPIINHRPQTVDEAWDAMKAAGELPYLYKSANAPTIYHKEKPASTPNKTPMLPSTEDFLQERIDRKKKCNHRRYPDNSLNIKWMEHSNHIILGVCGQCFSQFDTREPQDNDFFLEDIKARRNAGKAGSHAVAKPAEPIQIIEPPKKLSIWARFKNWITRVLCTN